MTDAREIAAKVRRLSPDPNRGCSIPGCERQHEARGLCATHHRRVLRGIPLDSPLKRSGSGLSFSERLELFVERDPNSGCWLWSGAIRGKGYGMTTLGGKNVGAHRASWLFHNGEIPPGLFVCHRCDTPLCVNPAHLFLGTSADNVADMHAKGRDARGERQGATKLTNADVSQIKGRLRDGEKAVDLARGFNVSQASISRIKSEKAWTHVDAEAERARK